VHGDGIDGALRQASPHAMQPDARSLSQRRMPLAGREPETCRCPVLMASLASFPKKVALNEWNRGGIQRCSSLYGRRLDAEQELWPHQKTALGSEARRYGSHWRSRGRHMVHTRAPSRPLHKGINRTLRCERIVVGPGYCVNGKDHMGCASRFCDARSDRRLESGPAKAEAPPTTTAERLTAEVSRGGQGYLREGNPDRHRWHAWAPTGRPRVGLSYLLVVES
jgi:hypothetical protein